MTESEDQDFDHCGCACELCVDYSRDVECAICGEPRDQEQDTYETPRCTECLKKQVIAEVK